MRPFTFLLAICLVGVPAFAAEKPLPSGITILTADQAKNCQFVDVVTAMRFALTSASKTSRSALIAALDKAKEKGANGAVILSSTVDHNQHQFTLNAYKCS